MKEFTKEDHGNKELHTFCLSKAVPTRHKLLRGTQMAVYNTEDTIAIVERMTANYTPPTNAKHVEYIARWSSHLTILKELLND